MKKVESSLSLRAILVWGNLLLTCLLVLGIFIFLEIICFNHSLNIDLTPEKTYTLSDQTKKVLNKLEDKVEFISFYKMGERVKLDEFYQMLTAHCPKIKYRLIDLNRNPGKAKMYGVSNAITLVEYRGKRENLSYPTEAEVISVILKLTHKRKNTIYFSKGHKEGSSYSSLKKALETENWNLKDVNLTGKSDIPLENSVLMICGPKKTFLQPEISIIEQYLQKGGKIVLMLEPFTNLPGLEKLLKNHGVLLKQDIIVDQENKLYGGDYLAPLVPSFSKAPITINIRSSSMFPTARSLETIDDMDETISVQPFARTSIHSWTTSNRESVKKGNISFKQGVDRSGPVNVGVWITIPGEKRDGRQTNGELICFGDSDFAKDAFYDILGNKDLILNTIEWLGSKTDLISIRPNTFEYPYHFLSAGQGRFLFWTSVVVIPAVFMITGIVVLLFRRARG